MQRLRRCHGHTMGLTAFDTISILCRIGERPIPMPDVQRSWCGRPPTCLRKVREGQNKKEEGTIRLFDQTMFERIPGEIRSRFEMEFLDNASPIGTDTFDAQRELFGNMRDGFAMGNQTQDLKLTV